MAIIHTPTTSEEYKGRLKTWHGFVTLMKYSVISTVVVLGLMALFLI